MWHVYVLRCGDGTFYTGISTDLAARVEKHNAGRGAKYTRRKLPVELVYSESFRGRGRAGRREAEIKGMSRPEKEALWNTKPISTS